MSVTNTLPPAVPGQLWAAYTIGRRFEDGCIKGVIVETNHETRDVRVRVDADLDHPFAGRLVWVPV